MTNNWKSFGSVSKVIIVLLLLGLVNEGCLETVTEIPITLSLSANSMNFSTTGGEQPFSIETNTQSWNVASDASWLTVFPSSGSGNREVTVSATTHTTLTPRTATITVTGLGAPQQTINITQAAVEATLSVSTSSISFTSTADVKTFSLTSNTSWSITRNGVTWFTVSNSSGTGNSTITLTATANTSTTPRTATLTVSGGGKTHNIAITQAAAPNLELTVSLSSLSFSASGEEKTFSITSNASWSMTRNGATWFTLTPSSGTGDKTITAVATVNTSSSQRTASVTVTGAGKTHTIAVTQAGKSPLNPDMVLVQGGSFTMGCTGEQGIDCYPDERPAHQVTLSSFYIGKYEVTEEQWKAVMGNNPSIDIRGDNYPVERVSWNDIVGTTGSYMDINGVRYYENGYIYKLNQQTGKRYRLPTEAEWEYAARGGNQSKGFKYSGNNTVDNVAWYTVNSSNRKHTVGSRSPNELGIYDMSGNVWEWCSDWFNDKYYSNYAQTNPQGPSSGYFRVTRGGCWYFIEVACRVSHRDYNSVGTRSSYLGFRLAQQL